MGSWANGRTNECKNEFENKYIDILAFDVSNRFHLLRLFKQLRNTLVWYNGLDTLSNCKHTNYRD